MLTYELSLAKYKMRDYELDLALNELKGQFPEISCEIVLNKKVKFSTEKPLDIEKVKRLTYFSLVEFQNGETPKSSIVPDQVFIEKINSNEQYALFNNLPTTKREIRYLTHSFHEYKGRYYPQLAKSLINYAGVKEGDTLFDPFCGSGTGLVESFLYGLNAFGTDINPVAYLIAKSKIRSLFIKKTELDNCLNQYSDYLKSYVKIDYNNFKDSLDIDYLLDWFPEENLSKFLFLLEKIEKEPIEDVQLLLKVTLSNILKEYSYQDPTQLRIRRRKDQPKTNLFEDFIAHLEKNANTLKNFINIDISHNHRYKVENYLCDIKELQTNLNIEKNSVDVVVTSPPYVTALPYIDTDRISLFAFGLAKSREAFRKLEKTMIGNREITHKEQQIAEKLMISSFDSDILPSAVIKLIEKIHFLNKHADVGFRRKNMAVLTFKYFLDMKLAMVQIHDVLKFGKYAFFVVGNNKTLAGNEQINIPTDDFIGLIGESIGFEFEKKISLDVQKSYTIYSKNAINTESILVFKKKEYES